MPKFNRDGVEIYYEVHGEGPPFLMSHGYSATSQMWRPQIETITRTHSLITWDMRGHGQSDYPEEQAEYSEAATVGDMAALLDHLGHDAAVIGGLSLGGYMSLAFYLACPERVKALVIFDTGPGYKNDQARAAWNETSERTKQNYRENGLEALKSRSTEMASSVHRSAEGLIRAAEGMLKQKDDRVIQLLPNIKVPTLIIVGSEDKPFHAACDYMAAKIPGARKIEIQGAGHAANIDQPERVNEALADFLGHQG